MKKKKEEGPAPFSFKVVLSRAAIWSLAMMARSCWELLNRSLKEKGCLLYTSRCV